MGCRPVTQEQKDADPKAEENHTNVHMAHVKKGLAQLKVCLAGTVIRSAADCCSFASNSASGSQSLIPAGVEV